MSELQTKIKTVADQFAKAIIGAIRGMTLEQLVELVGGAGKSVAKAAGLKRRGRPPKAVAAVVVKPNRKITNSPALRAARKIQGQYLGLMRKFSPREKLQIKALARKQSVAAAVAEMKKRLGRT